MSTIPHAIQPSHEGPFPQPSPQRSVKDVLITPCKGCHETEHTLACAFHNEPRAFRFTGTPFYFTACTNSALPVARALLPVRFSTVRGRPNSPARPLSCLLCPPPL